MGCEWNQFAIFSHCRLSSLYIQNYCRHTCSVVCVLVCVCIGFTALFMPTPDKTGEILQLRSSIQAFVVLLFIFFFCLRSRQENLQKKMLSSSDESLYSSMYFVYMFKNGSHTRRRTVSAKAKTVEMRDILININARFGHTEDETRRYT